MKSLGSFFEKFERLIPPERFVKKAVCDALEEVIGVRIGKNAVFVRGDTVSVHAPSTIKSEIKLREAELVSEINKKLAPSPRRVRGIF